MAEREHILATVDAIYEARVAEDMAALRPHLTSAATFHMNASQRAPGAMPLGPVDAYDAVERLIGTYRFHSAERVEEIVDGNRAAVRMRIQVSARGTDEAVTTELVDLWEFDDEGRVVALSQFPDTALAAALLNEA